MRVTAGFAINHNAIFSLESLFGTLKGFPAESYYTVSVAHLSVCTTFIDIATG